MECTIRMIEDRDVGRILQIYESYILNTPVTFEYTVSQLSKELIEEILAARI